MSTPRRIIAHMAALSAAMALAAGCSSKRQNSSFDTNGTHSAEHRVTLDTDGPDEADPKLVREPNLTGEHLYIIHFVERPLATYGGGIPGLPATSPMAPENRAQGMRRLDTRSPASLAYKEYLDGLQRDYLDRIARVTGRTLVVRSFRTALNAVSMHMTQAEALEVSRLPEVKFIERDEPVQVETDRGPAFIGAPAMWDGSATGVASMGEGIVIGIIDTGVAIDVIINGHTDDHPSFAAVDDDGYEHVNPLGDGVYLGGCIEHPEWCNDKLIGVYSFLGGHSDIDEQAPDDHPIWLYKDVSGHGSHVASIAAGNVLYDVAFHSASGQASEEVLFPRMSGVAPRANIVGFKICAPSCFRTDSAAAVEQAIDDGVVDVLNHSVGNVSRSPWRSTSSLAFLSAQAAGIFVTASAGNGGPDPGSAGNANSAPWVAGVGNISHDRTYPDKQLTSMLGGDTPPPADFTGRGITDSFSGPIVWARDFPFGNPGEDSFDQPEQCLDPFPLGTFSPDTIVLCDRGSISRLQKGRNVAAGGAGAMILANLAGGAASVVADPHVLPAIQLNSVDGDLLRAWLSSGTGHTGTITATGSPVLDPSVGDIMRTSSSRGPYTDFDFLAPTVVAPGVGIFGAGAQVLFEHPGSPSVPGLYGSISGSSMASPNLAGAAALLMAVHPDWSNAEILSAFMTTGSTAILKQDGTTPADSFDIGGGRIQLGVAANAGLLFAEIAESFINANPEAGGDPVTLNTAALVQDACAVRCSWQRTVRAAADGSWTVTHSPYLTVTPTDFTLSAGDAVTVDVEADAEALTAGEYSFGELVFTPQDPSLSTQRVAVAVQPANHNIPTEITIVTPEDTGSYQLTGLYSTAPITELSYQIHGLNEMTDEVVALLADSDTDSAYDDLSDGIDTRLLVVPAYAERLIAEISTTDALFNAVRVGEDVNGDGLPADDEELCAGFGDQSEIARCVLDLGGDRADEATYWVLVQNRRASTEGATDDITLSTAIVETGEQGNLTVAPTAGTIEAGQAFEIGVSWNQPMDVDDRYFARVRLYSTATQDPADLLAVADIRIVRAEPPPLPPDAGVPDASPPPTDAGVEIDAGEPDPPDDDGCGCTVGAASPEGRGNGLLWLLVGALIFGYRRRRC